MSVLLGTVSYREALRFLPAMRMVWEAGTRLNAEVIKHQEWREIAQLRCPYGSTDASTSALGLLDSKENLANCTWDRHLGRDELLGRVVERGVGRRRSRRLDVTSTRVKHGGVCQNVVQLLRDSRDTGCCKVDDLISIDNHRHDSNEDGNGERKEAHCKSTAGCDVGLIYE